MPGFDYGSQGDGTWWSSERGEPKPGGGSTGNSGSGNSSSGGSGNGASGASGNWAGTGPVNTALINAAIVEALTNGLPRNTVAATQTPAYLAMRAAFDALPVSEQPAARVQINDAWQKAHDGMPDNITIERDTAEHTITITSKNLSKKTMEQAVRQVTTDMQSALEQNQAKAASAAAAAAAAEAVAAKQRQDAIAAAAAAGSNQTVAQSQTALSQASNEAAAANSAAWAAKTQAQQARQAATSAEAAAVAAEKTYSDLVAKTTGKSPAGTKYSVKNGEYGYYKTITRDTAEHTITYEQWYSTGIKVTQRDAAQADAANKRNFANAKSAEARDAETASYNADIAAQNAETRRLAAVAALTASQNEAARRAAEEKAKQDAAIAAQKAAEEAAQKAAEEARIAAEKAKAMQARQAAADKLLSPAIQSVRGIPANAALTALPLNWSVAGAGGVALGSDVASSVARGIASALANLRALAAASLLGPIAVTVVGLLFPKNAGDPSDSVVPGRDLSNLIPGNILSLPDAATLNDAANRGIGISMPVRGRMVLTEDGMLQTQLVRTPDVGTVPVVRATLDSETGYYGYTLPALAGVPAQTILVSPSDAPGVQGQLTLTGPVPLPERILNTGDQIAINLDETTVSPVSDDIDFNDLVLIFPSDSGLAPVYVMYRDLRNIPSTVTGSGKPAGSNWLGDASSGNGAATPSSVADKLRGKTFSSFNAFRRAYWKAVADDPDLSTQFGSDNIARLKKGRAPVARFRDTVGKRTRIELHHIKEISQGGGVMDVDNINAVTPKRHIDIHRGK